MKVLWALAAWARRPATRREFGGTLRIALSKFFMQLERRDSSMRRYTGCSVVSREALARNEAALSALVVAYSVNNSWKLAKLWRKASFTALATSVALFDDVVKTAILARTSFSNDSATALHASVDDCSNESGCWDAAPFV
jgi:hypothetical protein